MRTTTLLGLLLIALDCSAQGTWLYQYPVTFGSIYERTWVLLEDGTALDLDYGQTGRLTFEDVAKWTKGEQLSIAFSSETGEVLIDANSGNWIPVAHGPTTHSIDRMKEACLEVEMTTRGMVGCNVEAIKLWELEMQRCYKRLEATLEPKQMATIVEAHGKWIAFREAQTAAINAVYTEGTISQIFRASAVEDLVKQRARELQTMVRGGT